MKNKVELCKKILDNTKKNTDELKENVQEIKKESKKSLNDNDLYDVLQSKSIKLQNRVSEILIVMLLIALLKMKIKKKLFKMKMVNSGFLCIRFFYFKKLLML